LIVKTGQMTLQVATLDAAVSQAQSQIAGMSGYVASSSRSGSADNASASVTYRLPVAHWDDALADLRKLASKVVSEQTDTSDVTSQAIDLDARLSNLKTTESALQAIMARATAIPDVLAVEQQLSTTQGQIEQLTAQRNHLGDQAAMSTVAVTFTLPNETVTTQTTQGWQLGGQIDQAVAQLVRIGQGLVTIVVWAVIVGLPVLLALLVLFLAWRLTRRLAGRNRPRA
jgi:Ca-activated chloride channel family protein